MSGESTFQWIATTMKWRLNNGRAELNLKSQLERMNPVN